MSGSPPELAIERLTHEINDLAEALNRISAVTDTERYLELRRQITVLGLRRYYASHGQSDFEDRRRAAAH